MKFARLLSLFLLASVSWPQLIDAQNGYVKPCIGDPNTWGTTSGDGGPALSATFVRTGGVVKDAGGNFYVTDVIEHRIRKVDGQTGIVSTICGDGTDSYTGDGGAAVNATIGWAYNITLDQAGNIFFPDRINGVVRKIDVTTGIITTVGDSLNQPFTVVLDVLGNMYVPQLDRIVKIDGVTGNSLMIAGGNGSGYSGDGGPALNAQIDANSAFAIMDNGDIYFSQTTQMVHNTIIRKIDGQTGIISTIAGSVYQGYSGDGGPAINAIFNSVKSLCSDHNGNLYILDDDITGSVRIRKLNTHTGMINCIGGNGSYNSYWDVPAMTTGIRAFNIFVDIVGNIYYTDFAGHVFMIPSDNSNNYSAANFQVFVTKDCAGPTFTVVKPVYGTGLSIKTDFGDSTVIVDPILPGVTVGYAYASHAYNNSGVYQVTQTLYNGTTPVDSISFAYEHMMCATMSVQVYKDENSDCTYSTGTDFPIMLPISVEVDSNGTAIDTISCTSGFLYTAYGNTGDIYSFKLIGLPGDVVPTCPLNGIISDVLQPGVNPVKYLGVDCSVGNDFDLDLNVDSRAGIHLFHSYITPRNKYCNFQNAILTMNYHPSYTYFNSVPPPTTQVAGVATWNLNNLSSGSQLPAIFVTLDNAMWPFGLPVSTTYTITPTTGDIVPADNALVVVDTVVGGFDPNAIYVKPEGCVVPGTNLEYKITFENMGNGVAENIYILDTLPAGVDPASLKLKFASHNMFVEKIYVGPQVILKFIYPDIMLPDSSDHAGRHGSVVYTINTLNNYPIGTSIHHKAGIYFDYNAPVITNTASTLMCWPTNVNTITSKQEGILIYPNPATEDLTIKTDKRYTSYTISNSIGQVMMKNNLTAKESKFNIRSLAPGIYYISLKGEGSSEVRKFVKM